jgi:hypothetical protein
VILRTDSIKWRQAATQDVIDAPELTGSLDSPDIGSLFYCADDSRIPARVTANGAEILLREIEALWTRANLLRECLERARQSLGLLGGLLQEVIGKTEGGFPSNAGELRQLGGEIVDRSHSKTAA